MKMKPIIIKGEKLASPVEKGRPGGGKDNAYTYEEAKNNIIGNLLEIESKIKNEEEIFLSSEIIVCARMANGYMAKSYMPDFLQKNSNISIIGARKYSIEGSSEKSKLYFIKTDLEGLGNLKSNLESNNLNKTSRDQLCNLEKIDLLHSSEKISGFNDFDNEDAYDVEIVLHPLKENYRNAIKIINEYIGENYIVRKYKDGPIFILAHLDKNKISYLANFNFLRTLHPLRNIVIDNTNNKKIDGNLDIDIDIAKRNLKNMVKVGVFDGGVSSQNKLIEPFVNSYDISSEKATQEGIQHGTCVCGAVLFGEINKYKELPTPKVLVESFRVIPEKNIYFIIDNIEKIINDRSDIKIYNISFGPEIPIDDDEINRFTYALDKIAYEKNILFCVAVGNAGEVVEPFNRIQPPSDIVNGIGVGAYSEYNGKKYRASYSCIGRGREGAKVKPDILAFGGDELNPFHSISTVDDEKLFIQGTSFASPVVARKAAELLYLSNEITPLMARGILLHRANRELDNPIEEGFGILNPNIDDIVNCSDNEVTLVYKGSLLPKTYMKFPIPLPDLENTKGKVELEWTVTSNTPVNALDSDGYTALCIDDKFHPNEAVFKMTKKGSKPKQVNLSKDYKNYLDLEQQGYKISKFQVSDSPKYFTEEERRLDLQWDTVKRRFKNKMIGSINNPCLVLHCIPRGDEIIDKIDFCLVITVKIKNFACSLYDSILSEYPILTPLTLRHELYADVEV